MSAINVIFLVKFRHYQEMSEIHGNPNMSRLENPWIFRLHLFLAGHLLLKLQVWDSINPSIHLSSLGLGISKVNRKMTWMTFRNQTTIPSQKREDTHLIHTKSLLDSADAMFPSLFIFWCPPPKKKPTTTHHENDDGTCRAAGGGGAAVGGMYFSAEVSSPASARRLRSRRSSSVNLTFGSFFFCFFRDEESSHCWCWLFFFCLAVLFFLGGILGYFFLMTYML